MWYGPHRMTFTVKRPYFFYFGFVRGCHHCFGHFELDLNLKTHNYVQIYVFSRNYDFLRSIITVNVRNFYFKNLTFHDFFSNLKFKSAPTTSMLTISNVYVDSDCRWKKVDNCRWKKISTPKFQLWRKIVDEKKWSRFFFIDKILSMKYVSTVFL